MRAAYCQAAGLSSDHAPGAGDHAGADVAAGAGAQPAEGAPAAGSTASSRRVALLLSDPLRWSWAQAVVASRAFDVPNFGAHQQG